MTDIFERRKDDTWFFHFCVYVLLPVMVVFVPFYGTAMIKGFPDDTWVNLGILAITLPTTVFAFALWIFAISEWLKREND